MRYLYCDYCDYYSNLTADYNKHLKTKIHFRNILKIENADKILKKECRVCDKTFMNDNYKKHINRNELKFKFGRGTCNEFTCGTCGKHCPNDIMLQKHFVICDEISEHSTTLKNGNKRKSQKLEENSKRAAKVMEIKAKYAHKFTIDLNDETLLSDDDLYNDGEIIYQPEAYHDEDEPLKTMKYNRVNHKIDMHGNVYLKGNYVGIFEIFDD